MLRPFLTSLLLPSLWMSLAWLLGERRVPPVARPNADLPARARSSGARLSLHGTILVQTPLANSVSLLTSGIGPAPDGGPPLQTLLDDHAALLLTNGLGYGPRRLRRRRRVAVESYGPRFFLSPFDHA